MTAAEFAADHQERLNTVGPLLTRALADEIDGSITCISSIDHLVVTHGDPGSGNYLDSNDDNQPGVLLDWETASVSPLGLDLGRAVFIGLMDLGRSGIPNQLADAFVRAYCRRSLLASQLSGHLLRAWVTIAGLQFIHGRHTRPLVPDRTPPGRGPGSRNISRRTEVKARIAAQNKPNGESLSRTHPPIARDRRQSGKHGPLFAT